jgi:hypothetical protein
MMTAITFRCPSEQNRRLDTRTRGAVTRSFFPPVLQREDAPWPARESQVW